MICSNCKMRWADFPEDDFKITKIGIVAKTEKANNKRLAVFNSNEIKYCGCIERNGE